MEMKEASHTIIIGRNVVGNLNSVTFYAQMLGFLDLSINGELFCFVINKTYVRCVTYFDQGFSTSFLFFINFYFTLTYIINVHNLFINFFNVFDKFKFIYKYKNLVVLVK